MGKPRLEVCHLSKTFAGVRVLADAHLSIEPGEIHALIGQNGSGKSTLIKLISGVHTADPGGQVLVDGHRIGTPVRAARLHQEGLAFVHQDLGLVPDLTVRENVRVGRHSVRGLTRWIDVARDREAVARTFAFLGLPIDPEAKVASLAPSERVAVAVARALQERAEGSGTIVFDESSRAIPHEALPAFHDMVRLLAAQGSSVLFVSHDLTEVLDLAHRVTALRNGRVVEAGVPTDALDEVSLTRLVLGREGVVQDLVRELPHTGGADAVEFHQFRAGRVHDFTATIRRGEVVGITGTADSGLVDLPDLLGGARPGQGSVTVGGRTLDAAKARTIDHLRAGIALIPQDRAGKGLATGLTVEENITAPHLTAHGRRWWMGRTWRRLQTDQVLDTFEVSPRSGRTVVATLSGGNQQKVLMGKWLAGGPALLILDEPTQAVDVGARAALLRATRVAAQQGTSVLYCTSEVDDLAAVCDRVLVLRDGVVADELRAPFTSESILDATFSPVSGEAV